MGFHYSCALFSHVPVPLQVMIPVSGSKSSGMLRSNATVRNGKWEVDSVVLRFNNTTHEIVLVDNAVGDNLTS